MEENLKKAHYSSDDLLEQLRHSKAFKTADVEFAVLEPSGQVSVLMKSSHQPITLANLGFHPPQEQETQTVIMDGNLMKEPLATIGRSPGWLMNKLQERGVSLSNVYLAQLDDKGSLYLDLYDDKMPSQSD